MFFDNYGLRVFKAGFILHRDEGRLVDIGDGVARPWRRRANSGGCRRIIQAFSRSSQRNLEFIAANTATDFGSMVTLTYHAELESWEGDAERNLRIVRRSKADLNRFLSCVRQELGGYLWVQEFQQRGVVHYHLMCEGTPSQARLALAWCRSTGELDDEAAVVHSVKVERVRGQKGVRSYLGRYLGKGRQKCLPPGVERAGRWWGRSRGQTLSVVGEIVSREQGAPRNALAVRVIRSVRGWLRHELKFRVSGGRFVDWGGRLSRRLLEVATRFEKFYSPEWSGQFLKVEMIAGTGAGGGE